MENLFPVEKGEGLLAYLPWQQAFGLDRISSGDSFSTVVLTSQPLLFSAVCAVCCSVLRCLREVGEFFTVHTVG